MEQVPVQNLEGGNMEVANEKLTTVASGIISLMEKAMLRKGFNFESSLNHHLHSEELFDESLSAEELRSLEEMIRKELIKRSMERAGSQQLSSNAMGKISGRIPRGSTAAERRNAIYSGKDDSAGASAEDRADEIAEAIRLQNRAS